VRIDDAVVPASDLGRPLEMDPGEHMVSVSTASQDAAPQAVNLAEGETKTLSFDLGGGGEVEEGDEQGEASSDGFFARILEAPTPAFALMGLGAAGLIAGGVTGGLALGKASDLKNVCPANPCPSANQSLADDANLLATVSTISFAAGGAMLAGGVVWAVLATQPDEEPASAIRIEPVIGPGYVGAQGSF
jgi:hypothetical protein